MSIISGSLNTGLPGITRPEVCYDLRVLEACQFCYLVNGIVKITDIVIDRGLGSDSCKCGHRQATHDLGGNDLPSIRYSRTVLETVDYAWKMLRSSGESVRMETPSFLFPGCDLIGLDPIFCIKPVASMRNMITPMLPVTLVAALLSGPLPAPYSKPRVPCP